MIQGGFITLKPLEFLGAVTVRTVLKSNKHSPVPNGALKNDKLFLNLGFMNCKLDLINKNALKKTHSPQSAHR